MHDIKTSKLNPTNTEKRGRSKGGYGDIMEG
jgi:hypothetical protein